MHKNRWRKLYEAHAQFICPYCLKHFPLSKATIEHEPPQSRQRILGPSKTFLACGPCNHEKGALTAEEYELWKKTKDYLTWVKLENIRNGRYILFNGDTFDAILLGDRKRAAAHHITNTDNQLNVKLNEAYEFFKPYQKNILFIGRGNHEESILKYNGLDVIEMLTTMLNMGQEHKILYGNYANFLRFTFKEAGKNMKGYHYDIYAHHGAGGSAPSTKGMLDFAALAKGINADLIWIGHKHNALVDYSAPVMHIDRSGDVVLKNRQCIETPSYQKGRTIDYNANFAERFYNHTAMSGFGEVNLKCVANAKTGYQIIPEIKITTIPQMIIGKAQTAILNQKER